MLKCLTNIIMLLLQPLPLAVCSMYIPPSYVKIQSQSGEIGKMRRLLKNINKEKRVCTIMNKKRLKRKTTWGKIDGSECPAKMQARLPSAIFAHDIEGLRLKMGMELLIKIFPILFSNQDFQKFCQVMYESSCII